MSRPRLPMPPREELRQGYAEHNCKELATRYGVSPSTVQGWLHRYGIPLRPCGTRRKIEGDQVDDVTCRYLAGESTEEIADDYGVSRTTVDKILKDVEVPTRRRGPRQVGRNGWQPRRRGPDPDGHDRPTLRRLLADHGLKTRVSVPVPGYTAAIATGRVAIDVWMNGMYPLLVERVVRRVDYLGRHGWSVVYVWVTAGRPLGDSCVPVIKGFVDLVAPDPDDQVGRYLVVRGDGDLVATGTSDLDM